MLIRFLALAALTAVCLPAKAAAATATFNLADGRTLVASYSVLNVLASRKVVLQGKPARMKLFEKTGVLAFDASADTITINPSGAADGKAISGIGTAELSGSVALVYESSDAGGKRVRTTASSDAATYNGAEEAVYLKGSVKVRIEDPALFEGPGEMTGDEAMVRLGAKLGPEDVRFRISSSEGVSTIRATPAPKQEKNPAK